MTSGHIWIYNVSTSIRSELENVYDVVQCQLVAVKLHGKLINAFAVRSNSSLWSDGSRLVMQYDHHRQVTKLWKSRVTILLL